MSKLRADWNQECYQSVQNLLSSNLLSRNIKIKIDGAVILLIILHGFCHIKGGTQGEGVRE
jgi:hypothetical protein